MGRAEGITDAVTVAVARQARDTLHTGLPLDALAVESPVPAIQPIFEFLLNLPGPLLAVGGVAGAAAVAAAALFTWRQRRALGAWLVTRPRGLRIAFAATLAAVGFLAAAGGAWTYNYAQHENAFCNSCHIMNEAYMRFAGSEHANLGCHDCHRQSLATSLRQLVLWVAERPEDIPPHSPVPTEICGECHLQWEPDPLWMTDEAWRNVGVTAGHILHMQSGHPDLVDVQCADCHGVFVHRFIPVEATCLSCHSGLEIQLGRMATAPQAFHCAACHEFTGRVDPAPALADAAARRVISPSIDQCYGCHQMEQVLPREQLAAEPHEAACALCHNPHTQVRVEEAGAGCALAGCHDQPEALTPFHRGLHASALEGCVGCHTAHDFRVDGRDCLACHSDIYQRAASAAPPPAHPPDRPDRVGLLLAPRQSPEGRSGVLHAALPREVARR